eukprot:COSAG01_NODE_3363_length_6195_cov_4.239665_8_plen_47_part_00
MLLIVYMYYAAPAAAAAACWMLDVTAEEFQQWPQYSLILFICVVRK